MVSTLSAACPIHSPVKQQLLFSLFLDMRESNASAELTELCQRDPGVCEVRAFLLCYWIHFCILCWILEHVW